MSKPGASHLTYSQTHVHIKKTSHVYVLEGVGQLPYTFSQALVISRTQLMLIIEHGIMYAYEQMICTLLRSEVHRMTSLLVRLLNKLLT